MKFGTGFVILTLETLFVKVSFNTIKTMRKMQSLFLVIIALCFIGPFSMAQGYDEMYGDYSVKPRNNQNQGSNYSYDNSFDNSSNDVDSRDYDYDAFIEEDGYYTSRLRRYYGGWDCFSYYDPFFTNSWYWGWNPPLVTVVTTPTIWGGWRSRIIWSYGWGWNTYYYNPFLYSGWGYNPWGYGFYNPWYGFYNPWWGGNSYMAGYMAGYNAGYNNGYYNGWWGNPYGWGYNPYGWDNGWGWRYAPRNSSGGMVTNNSGRGGNNNVSNINPGRTIQQTGGSGGRGEVSNPRGEISNPRGNNFTNNNYNYNTTPRPNNNVNNNIITVPRGENNNPTPRNYQNNNPITPRSYQNNNNNPTPRNYNTTPRNFNNSNSTPRSYTPNVNSGSRSTGGGTRISPR